MGCSGRYLFFVLLLLVEFEQVGLVEAEVFVFGAGFLEFVLLAGGVHHDVFGGVEDGFGGRLFRGHGVGVELLAFRVQGFGGISFVAEPLLHHVAAVHLVYFRQPLLLIPPL